MRRSGERRWRLAVHRRYRRLLARHGSAQTDHAGAVGLPSAAEAAHLMRFDLIVSFDSPNMRTMFDHVVADVREAFPGYDVQVQFDFDVSD